MLQKPVLLAFVWVHRQLAAVKQDSDPVVVEVPKAPSHGLDLLNLAVKPFGHGVGDPVLEIGYDPVKVALDGLGGFDHGIQPRVGGPEEPLAEELGRRLNVRIIPEIAECLLDRPGPADLKADIL